MIVQIATQIGTDEVAAPAVAAPEPRLVTGGPPGRPARWRARGPGVDGTLMTDSAGSGSFGHGEEEDEEGEDQRQSAAP